MDILEISEISLGLSLTNINEVNELYKNQFDTLKYYYEVIKYPKKKIKETFSLPLLNRLYSEYNNKEITLENGKKFKCGIFKNYLNNTAYVFGKVCIPFEDGSNKNVFPTYFKNDNKFIFLDQDTIFLIGNKAIEELFEFSDL